MTIVNKHSYVGTEFHTMSSELMSGDIVLYDMLNMSGYEVLTESVITSTIHNASCQLFENFTECVEGNTTQEDTGSGYFYKVRQNANFDAPHFQILKVGS